MWKEKVVPTIEDMEQVLRPIHWNQGKKHCIDIRKLKAAMQDNEFIKPHFMERLERGCLLSGNSYVNDQC